MIFNGIDLSAYLAVTKVARPVTASRRLEATQVPGMDGAHVADQGLEACEVEVECNILARTVADVADVRRLVSSALHSDSAARLVLDDDPGRALVAWYKGGAEPSRNARKPGMTLTFLCEDPVAYGSPRSASVGTGAAAVDAGGNYRAFPTVTCKPPSGSYWTLFNVTTGEFVRVEAGFTGSQEVVLDMARERCTVNGSDHAVTLDSDFFALDGVEQLKTSGGTATVSWEERWL